MANDFTVNPIIVDTEMVANASIGRPIRVKRIIWFNPTTAGQLFNIGDGSTAANVLLTGRAEVNAQSQVFDLGRQIWKDFLVDDLDSGTLYIYY